MRNVLVKDFKECSNAGSDESSELVLGRELIVPSEKSRELVVNFEEG